MKGIRFAFVTEPPAETVVELYQEAGWWDERWSRKAIPRDDPRQLRVSGGP